MARGILMGVTVAALAAGLAGCSLNEEAQAQAYAEAIAAVPGVDSAVADDVGDLPFSRDTGLTVDLDADPDVLAEVVETACDQAFGGNVFWELSFHAARAVMHASARDACPEIPERYATIPAAVGEAAGDCFVSLEEDFAQEGQGALELDAEGDGCADLAGVGALLGRMAERDLAPAYDIEVRPAQEGLGSAETEPRIYAAELDGGDLAAAAVLLTRLPETGAVALAHRGDVLTVTLAPETYADLFEGNGVSIEEARPAIEQLIRASGVTGYDTAEIEVIQG